MSNEQLTVAEAIELSFEEWCEKVLGLDVKSMGGLMSSKLIIRKDRANWQAIYERCKAELEKFIDEPVMH